MAAADQPVVEHQVGAGSTTDHEEWLAELVELGCRIPFEADLDSERLGQSTFGGKLVEENWVHDSNLAHIGCESRRDESWKQI